ncbi:MAG: c-type cytochrome [Myxococcales bacterium]|nr:c-type cytochrome [Myxococcales bacterium]
MQLLRQASALAVASILVIACGDSSSTTTDSDSAGTDSTTEGGDSETAGEDGRKYYDGAESIALGASGNQVSCATCHSDDGTQAGHSGNTFMDIAYHESFKGNGADLLTAVNACVTGWMGGTALAESDDAFVGLKSFMESISSVDATTPNVVAPEVLDDELAYEAAYGGGDAAAGADAYATSCAICHDNALMVGAVAAYPKASLMGYTTGRIAQKVRTSGPPPSGALDMADSTPGPMPFFEVKDVSEADLANIIAHLQGG